MNPLPGHVIPGQVIIHFLSSGGVAEAERSSASASGAHDGDARSGAATGFPDHLVVRIRRPQVVRSEPELEADVADAHRGNDGKRRRIPGPCLDFEATVSIRRHGSSHELPG